MIFFFTGTGNSMYAAREIARAAGDGEPVSIPHALRSGSLRFTDDTIGIVAPIYGHEMPAMVKDFIRRAEFDTGYTYLVLTYGNRHANAVELAKDVFDGAGKKADLIRTLLMVDNFLPGFDMSEQQAIDKDVDGQLRSIVSDVAARRRYIEKVTAADRAAHRSYMELVGGRPETVWADFDFTDACVGCGMCQKVCPAGCIHVDKERRRAVRDGENCQACMACVHVCPASAIRLNPVLGFTDRNPEARYRNENVTLTDLLDANA
jgi:formate hydrogenlyase subunit 6/NADH:ubiquinone oxidoreductase subunit I